MNLAAKLKSAWRSLFRRRAAEAEMAEEMRLHLELLTERNLAAGMALREARAAAQRSFGGVEQIKERCRDQRFGVWLEQWRQDIAFAVRSLARARGFSLAVIGTLAVGIGVATMVFELVSPTLLFASHFPQARQLYMIGAVDKTGANPNVYPVRWAMHLRAYEERTTVCSEFAAIGPTLANVVADNEVVAESVGELSPDCLHTLGIAPALGRAFLPNEYRAGANDVVLIGDEMWRRHFKADPAVLGRTVTIDRRTCMIVGVLRADQAWPPYFGHAVYRPMAMATFEKDNPFGHALFMIGRLKPGVSKEQASAAFDRVLLPELAPGARRYLEAQRTELQPLRHRPMAVTMATVTAVAGGLLYLTACFNAMNLMLVRLVGRGRELGIRLALGGSRGRIARLVALECAVLTLAAALVVTAVAGTLFPVLLPSIMGAESPGDFPLWDIKVLACIAGLSALAAVSIGLVPALRLTRTDVSQGLRSAGPAFGESRRLAGLRDALVVLQAALAVVLLSATGLMVRSFEKLHAVDLGLNPTGMVKVMLAFPADYDRTSEARLQLFERLEEKLAKLPGVTGVTYGEDSVLVGGFDGREDVEMGDGSYRRVTGNFVAQDYYRVAGLTMRRGRWFSPDRTQNEVVLSETMARALYGDRDPLEQKFKLKAYPKLVYRVVGVVHDIRESVRAPAGMRFYVPCWWYPPNISSMLLRLGREPSPEFAGLVRHAIYEFDPALLTLDVESLNELIDHSLWWERFAFRLLRVLAAIALGLASWACSRR